MAGDADRLRPHVNTYKLIQVVKMQMDTGIRCFKYATLSEAAMLLFSKQADIRNL